jgi:RNA polymerase sigma-70 factor (ECF subfamily)
VSEPTDGELLQRFLRKRDEDAFRRLHAAHGGALYLLAARLTRSDGEAEDVVQEVWLRVTTGRARFEGRSLLRTWLCGIVVNCARERRSSAAAPAVPPLQEVRFEQPPVDLERAVRALSDGFREVLVLHDVYGYTHEEIAAMLGIEAGTSKSQLSRARQRIREWMTEERR